MREVLYRGKEVDTGKWVFGWYNEGCFGGWPLRPAIIPSLDARSGYWNQCEVVPETVGQYSGLNDKNGKPIFEDDIVDEFNTVEFCNGCFCINGDRLLGEVSSNCEVIGNIHDNPELVEIT